MPTIEEQLRDVACPICKTVGSLSMEMRLRAKPVGSYSIAGVQTKVVAEDWPYLVCGIETCDYVEAGKQ